MDGSNSLGSLKNLLEDRRSTYCKLLMVEVDVFMLTRLEELDEIIHLVDLCINVEKRLEKERTRVQFSSSGEKTYVR